MQFGQSTYIFDEDEGLAVFALILSNPSSTDITLLVLYDDDDPAASGELHIP